MQIKSLSASIRSIALVSLTIFLSATAHAADADLPMDSIDSTLSTAADAAVSAGLPKVTPSKGDQKFQALFTSWKRLDQIGQGVISIPSARPVEAVSMTSGYGVRSDPFRHGAAMH